MTVALGRCSIMLRPCQRSLPHTVEYPLVCIGRQVICKSKAGKGFGTSNKVDNDEDVGGRRRKAAKRVNIRREQTPIPGQGLMREPMSNPTFAAVENLEQQLAKKEEEEDFAKRLAMVRLEGEVRRKDAQASASTNPAAEAAFDIYTNPPSISDTLLNQLNSEVSDPKLKNAQFGPNQIGVAIGAVLLGLMFVLVSGADFATSKRYKGVRPNQDPPDGIEAALIKGRIAQLETAREVNPNDAAALEDLAVNYAELFEFEKAAKLLDKLVAVQPGNIEAWRLLGETTLLSQQPARSVAAYEKAVAISTSDIQVLTGLQDAYIANGQQAKAVDYLNKLKEGRQAAKAEAAAAAAAAAASSSEEGEVGQEAAAAGVSKAQVLSTVDDATLDLLVAKVYSSWRGHDNDALAVYDALIKRSPEDFRGYLAKGLFLKENGRKSDAERMFMQARFYAPESRQNFIKQMAGSNPLLDLPDND